jgi:hypothetical protein
MSRATILIIVFGVFLLTSACAQQDISTLSQSVIAPTNEQEEDEIALQQEGIGPLEITPDSPNAKQPADSPEDQVEGNISSSGERSSGETINGELGKIDSVPPEGYALEQGADESVNWLTYRDQDYHFSIDYPDTYTILPENDPLNEVDTELIHRVRFLDAQLTTGDTAEYEPPNFTVEIYPISDQTLEEFINNDIKGGNLEAFTFGNLSGIRLYFIQLIAPNEFYYFSNDAYIYKLTPLGPYSQEMLQSFQIE